jgi:3-oxoacyl-[acyl-carrier protein] reductase
MVRVAGDATASRGRLMDLGLRDRVALVTGASKGIGRGIAAGLVQEGARVAIASRSAERIEEAASQIGARGYVFDAEDVDGVPGLLERVESDLGPVDIYIANTGGPPNGQDPLGFTREQWEAAHRSLVLTPMAFIERLLPGMRSRGFGRVVAIGSMATTEPIDNLQLSNAHRPGLVAAFKVLARQSARDGVTFNHVHPGTIATDRIFGSSGGREAVEARARDAFPSGRLGTVEELAAAAVFLCSVPAAYINGTSILVDGALTRSVS